MSDNPTRLGEWVDAVADQFEAAWKSVQPPRVSDFLDDATTEQRDALLTELREIDHAYRAKLGDQAAAHDTVTNADNPSADAAPTFPTIPGYDVEAELGQGGMSVVYLARHRTLKRHVALKLLRAGADASGRQRQRFRAEAEAAARLQHPNIAQVHEVGEHDGQLYLALEYVAGGSLSRHLAGKPLPARAAAALVETLARAMHYAHGHGIVHRDLKPANILVSFSGEPKATAPAADEFIPKIADFGLAKQLDADTGQTRTGEIVGTPSYMAPEQAAPSPQRQQGPCIGPLVDVYGLGAVLYELLTGRPPFQGETYLDTLEQVCGQEPVPPRQLQPKVPRDLETICLKALAKQPARRYASAELLADDLRRFLDGRPIVARPVGRTEKAWRWCRRNPGMAGMAAAVGVLLSGLTCAAILAAVEAHGREQDRHFEALLQQVQVVRLTPRFQEWSRRAWQRVEEAVPLRRDLALRNQAAATLGGLDASLSKEFEFGACWLAFDPEGRLLLLGGMDRWRDRPREVAKLRDITSGSEELLSDHAGAGPVAFRNRIPLQLAARDNGLSLFLWDMRNRKSVCECWLPPAEKRTLTRNNLDFPVVAVSTDASRIAAAAGPPGKGAVAVWDGSTGKLLRQYPREAHTLAFSSGASHLAMADKNGRIVVWSHSEDEPLNDFSATRLRVNCLAFSRDGRRLAAGDSGGTVTIWDWRSGRLLCNCLGSPHEVYAVAFSPDGTLLASGGRQPSKLWDAATGHKLLEIQHGDYIASLAFAQDGSKLAIGSLGRHVPPNVTVWNLEYGRGIRTLRGLASQVSLVRFSSDGRLAAALAHNWQVALWDTATGHLRRVLNVPQGVSADNAALAFSPDGRGFAFCTGTEARLWDDVFSEREPHSWRLPHVGLVDRLAFDPFGKKLVLFRAEKEHDKAPWVCRIRDLLSPQPLDGKALAEFSGRVLDAALAPDGSYVVINGIHDGPGGRRQLIKAYEIPGGKELWSPESRSTTTFGEFLLLDPSGRFLVFPRGESAKDADHAVLAEMPAGTFRDVLQLPLVGLGPGSEYLARFGQQQTQTAWRGFSLWRRADATRVIDLGIDTLPSFLPAYSNDGNLFAWGNPDGTVTVCDLRQIRGRLARVGLDW